MPTLRQNLEEWGKRYSWEKDGDEWDDQAAYCKMPYPEWKQSLIKELILPYIRSGSVVLEIAPGHGRWSEHIARHAKRAILVDMSERCIRHCRRRLRHFHNVAYFVNDGRSLEGVQPSSVDFVFSYDSFVHMEADVVSYYLCEMRRVLKIGGKALIHHSGRRHSTLWLWEFLEPLGKIGRVLYMVPSMGRISHNDGWRSNVSRELFARMAQDCGLRVVSQSDSWGGGRFNCRLFSDCISVLEKD